MHKVRTLSENNSNWEKRDWGVENLPVIQGEGMEMHLTKVFPNTVGIAHIHDCGTLYYVLKGTLISISGEQLQYIDVQRTGSFVHVPKNLLHTVANVSDDDEAITVVSHDALDVCTNTRSFPEYNAKLHQIFSNLKLTA